MAVNREGAASRIGAEPIHPSPTTRTDAADPLVFELRNVTRRFGASTALDAISIEFPPRQVTAVVGASGCGKSTLLKLCNGLLQPDAGEVRAFGSPLNYRALPALRRRMGYAVQGTALFPHLCARDNITLIARLARWSAAAIDERLAQLTQLMHLDPACLDRHPHQLSGGQQQRVGLCRAMMLRPEALLLDEPFGAIDPITRYDIHQQLLELLGAEPTTVLLVTHDMHEAMLLAQRIVVMHAGRIPIDASVVALRADNPGLEPGALLRELLRAQR